MPRRLRRDMVLIGIKWAYLYYITTALMATLCIDLSCLCNAQRTGTDIIISPCGHGCQTCSPSSNQCIQCLPRWFMLLNRTRSSMPGRCVSTCPSGFYKRRSNISLNMCLRCPLNCSRCSSKHCTRCMAGTSLYRDKCVVTCPDGLHNANGRCRRVVHCKVSGWSRHSRCQVRSGERRTCAHGRVGFRISRRRILQRPSNAGKQCPPTFRRKRCCKKEPAQRRHRNSRKGRKKCRRRNRNDTKIHSKRLHCRKTSANRSYSSSRNMAPTSISFDSANT